MNRISLFLIYISLIGCSNGLAQSSDPALDSGGPMTPEQAAYDVTYYDLTLHVSPTDSSIQGSLAAHAKVVHPMQQFVLNLDDRLTVSNVATVGGTPLSFRHKADELWIDLERTLQAGDTVATVVTYGGKPRVAPNPPWQGGFTWARTEADEPWIATSCQTHGADLWWPNKDHPADEPDSMAIRITVPEPLVVASNGKLQGVETNTDGTRTYNWFVSTSINNYNVALNIAPYRVIEQAYESVDGTTFPVAFWVLPEDYEKGVDLFSEILDHLRFFEEHFGPYPFRADKYGVAQTPHLGMEHQTIIAYGANFNNGSMTGGKDWGFDALHHHELAHEWWGNLVTNSDWRDMWLHEGFGSYTQPLYAEARQGMERYHEYMNNMRGGIANQIPVAPREHRSTQQIYGGDIYSKGAWVLHTLRYLVGEEKLRTILRRMAYPDPAMEQVTDGRQTRFATTDDFLHIAEATAGMDLDWYFEVYLRQPDLPSLVTTRDGSQLSLRWEVPNDLPFPMPVDVKIGDEIRRVEMPNGEATIIIDEQAEVEPDPMNWILKE